MLLSHFQAGKQYRKTGEPWDTEKHLAQDTEILYRMINLEKKASSWTKEQLSFVSFETLHIYKVKQDNAVSIAES